MKTELEVAKDAVRSAGLEAEKAALLDVVKSIEAEFWFRCGDAQCKDDRCLMVDDLRNVIAKAWTRHDVGILTEAGRRENDRRRDAADALEVTPPVLRRCAARIGPGGLRCEESEGHDGDHRVDLLRQR